MTDKGTAEVFVGPNHPFETREYPIPKVQPKGLLVKVKMASVCGTDLHIWHGKRKASLPIILGHEAMGTVQEKGSELIRDSAGAKLSVGDRITWSYIKTCGECYYCSILKDSAGCLNRFVYGLFASCDSPPHFNGAFSEYIYLQPGTTFLKLPDDLSDEAVAPANCALVTMINVMQRAKLQLNESVIIQGCGPLGLYATALASQSGSSNVIVLDPEESRVAYSKQFGANAAICTAGLSNEDVESKIRDLTSGLGADVGVEATGVPSVIPAGLKLVRDGGRYVSVGPIFQGASAEIDLFNLIFRRITLIGTARNDAAQLFDAVRFLSRTKSKFPFDKIVGAKYPLDKIEDAFKTLDSRKVMRAAIVNE